MKNMQLNNKQWYSSHKYINVQLFLISGYLTIWGVHPVLGVVEMYSVTVVGQGGKCDFP